MSFSGGGEGSLGGGSGFFGRCLFGVEIAREVCASRTGCLLPLSFGRVMVGGLKGLLSPEAEA